MFPWLRADLAISVTPSSRELPDLLCESARLHARPFYFLLRVGYRQLSANHGDQRFGRLNNVPVAAALSRPPA